MYMEKQYPAGVKILAQSPTCRMDARETLATKTTEATAPWTAPGDVCFNNA